MAYRKGQRERTVLTATKDAEAAHLRAEGLTYPQIADRMGCAVSTAYESVQRAIAAVPVEAVGVLRQVECDRLDGIIAKLWDIINHDDTGTGDKIAALNGVMRTSESKRKLLGLDAPARQTVTVISEDAVDAELRRLEEELATRGRQDA